MHSDVISESYSKLMTAKDKFTSLNGLLFEFDFYYNELKKNGNVLLQETPSVDFNSPVLQRSTLYSQITSKMSLLKRLYLFYTHMADDFWRAEKVGGLFSSISRNIIPHLILL